MNIRFEEFTTDIEALIDFLTSDTWTYHGVSKPKPDRIRLNFKEKMYTGDDCKTFWIVVGDDTKAGMVRIYDLQDGTPLFDLRILSSYKGMGIGTITVNWLIEYIFNNFPDKDRIEGNTRQDNYAMRCVFHKCGFAREAHYRNAWHDDNGKLYDAVGYAIIKDDWESGEMTPVDWNDFVC